MADVKARIERIGPKMTLIYSKEWSPRRFRLIPTGYLPPENKAGDVATIEPSLLLTDKAAI